MLANNDIGAVSLAATLTRMGVDVPGDISIADWFTPALTTAKIRTDELGQVAWDAMSQMIIDPSTIIHSMPVATAVFRESTTMRSTRS